MANAAVDVAGTGFAVLDRVYADGDAAFEALGGSCGNVLVSLAMLEHSVAPVLALGRDAVGERLLCEFMRAGADTAYIFRHEHLASPVLAQRVDTVSGQHHFSFICPETDEALPRFQSIGGADVQQARHVLNACHVFYTDRLSDSILHAMELAFHAGALIYFEPSNIEDNELFERALDMTTIFKCSSERLHADLTKRVPHRTVSIVTHGVAGLEVSKGEERVWCAAVPAEVIRDTCGSGDMVSVGVIDWLIRRQVAPQAFAVSDILGGVTAGQRVASANCAYLGARGLFADRGAQYVRRLLDNQYVDPAFQPDLFDDA
ncbi:MAG: hypothetical protein HOP13_01115 [Alphaproteobacteria bacterium]|nr:hypothetical protein [Alphaproteobacteria bacterium]